MDQLILVIRLCAFKKNIKELHCVVVILSEQYIKITRIAANHRDSDRGDSNTDDVLVRVDVLFSLWSN